VTDYRTEIETFGSLAEPERWVRVHLIREDECAGCGMGHIETVVAAWTHDTRGDS